MALSIAQLITWDANKGFHLPQYAKVVEVMKQQKDVSMPREKARKTQSLTQGKSINANIVSYRDDQDVMRKMQELET